MDRTRTQSAENEKNLSGRIVYRIFPAALYALCGYLSGLCALPFGAHPFGFALLAAADKNAIFVFCGLAAASVTGFEDGMAALYLGIYTALLLLRILVRLTLDSDFARADGKRTLGELVSGFFCEKPGYRACAASIAALGISLASLISGGFLYYDLFGLLISVAAAPILTLILYGIFAPADKTSQDGRILSARDLGISALAAISAYAAAPIKIYGVSLAVAGGMLAVLCVCRRRGFAAGLLLSLAAGLAYSPKISPIFVICAISYAVFSKISLSLVSASSIFGALAYAFYVRGIHALDGIAGGIITAGLLFSAFTKLIKAEGPSQKDTVVPPVRCRVLEESELDSVRLFDMNRQMASRAEGFARLSDLFEEMKLKFPRKGELLSICEQAFDTSCAGCGEYSRCRRHGVIGEEIARICAALDKKGNLSVSDFSEQISDRCQRLPDIIDEINYNFEARFRRSEVRDSEFDVFSEDRNRSYKALSSLLGKSAESRAEEYLPDLSASALICEPLDTLESRILGVLVFGSRRKRVFIKGSDRSELERACEQICAVVRDKLGIELDPASARIRRSGRGEEGSVELWEKEKFMLSCVSRRSAASEESFCGDSIASFENSEGRFFCVLSDGMGSGRDAALMSELATGFVKNMLSAGEMNQEILDMLNSFLQSRYDSSACECSATLDLMEFDRVTGRATFYKCGAAPTYVYRNQSLFKIRSRTMPLGILPDAEARIVDFELDDGDVIVMMSDGVTGGREECPYLFDLLRQNVDGAGSARTADLIMKYAKGNGSQDDITVSIIRVERVAG